MPTYCYYPQGDVPAGAAMEARLDDDEAALAHAKEVAKGHPDAYEVSVWCDDRYVGRLTAPAPAAPPSPTLKLTPDPGPAKAKRARRAVSRPKRGATRSGGN